MRKIKKYTRLLLSFFRFSFQDEMQYRSNLIFYSIENILWILMGIVGVELIFGQTNHLAGWSKNEVFLVMFTAALFHDICWTFIFRNLSYFSHLIRHGKLDYRLLLPVNTRFLVSFRILEFDHYLRIAFELFLIYRYTVLVLGYFSWFNFLLYLFLLICGFVTFYGIFFAITVTNIWFVRLDSLVNFFHSLKDVGDKPVYIFQKGLFIFFSFILPVGFIATFPVDALLGRVDPVKLILGPIMAYLSLVLSQKFFEFALKHYTSASN